MEWYWALILLMGPLLVFMLFGLPVVFAFFLVNIVGAIIFLGGDPGLAQMVRNSIGAVAQISMVPIPLFIFMGEILYHTGMAAMAIDAVDRIIARLPGRLSLVAVVGGTIFSSLSGSTLANTAMLGSTLMPEMRKRGYDPTIAMGPIVATGGIAMLIPPSALSVLLGSLAKISIADLLIGGIVPGLMMAALFFTYIIMRCVMNPRLAPTYDPGRMTFRERYVPFLINVVPLMGIFVVVVGSILAGWATPTDSAALGAVASLVAALGYRKLSWENFKKSVVETAKVTSMILFIIAGSLTFSQILAFSGATQGFGDMIGAAGLTPFQLVLGVIVVLLFLGCFMDQVSMMMITLPLFMPLALAANINTVWLGILMLISLEMGLATPPFGLLLFVMKGVAPPDITMRQVIVSALPFIVLELIVLVALLLWPAVALWLPGLASS
ncbi:MAG TPA: TRAP transporter large permease subunit [Alphaproteobacteria bacterium]|jgi:tripartite ATP-independent transporter DctM subunit|nr:TRAP transporter large permease subunit [Alphaproteobacteria bacterium]